MDSAASSVKNAMWGVWYTFTKERSYFSLK